MTEKFVEKRVFQFFDHFFFNKFLQKNIFFNKTQAPPICLRQEFGIFSQKLPVPFFEFFFCKKRVVM